MNTRTTKFMQRGLVYGSLLGGIALLAFHSSTAVRDGRSSQPGDAPSISAATPGNDAGEYYTGPLRRVSLPPAPMPGAAPSQDWHKGAPILDKPIQLTVSNTPLNVAVSQIAQATGLNLVCFDAQGQGRVSLTLRHIPAWQAMQALADASGSHWEHHANLYTLRSGLEPAQTVASLESPQRRGGMALSAAN